MSGYSVFASDFFWKCIVHRKKSLSLSFTITLLGVEEGPSTTNSESFPARGQRIRRPQQ